MANRFAEIAFTSTVKAWQEKMGSRAAYARMEEQPETVHAALGDEEAGFIAERDSFYMASVSETGWPYIQHRGGPPGFVRILGERLIGFADFRGNRQYISAGNFAGNDRVALFFMDYASKMRLKLLGRVRLAQADDQEMMARLEMPDYPAKVERGILISVEAFDWNCPQHITERYTRSEIEALVAPMKRKIAALEAALADAKSSGGTRDPA